MAGNERLLTDKKGVGHGHFDGEGVGAVVPGGGLDAAGEAEEVICKCLQLHGGVIGQTEQLGGVFEETAFYIFVPDSIELDATVDAFELIGCVVIGQVGNLDPEGDELGVVIVVAIEPGLEGLARLILEIGDEQAIAEPVEEEETEQQYGCNLFQIA